MPRKKRELYLELKKSFKDAEMQLLARGGSTPEQAEAQYQLLSAAGVEQAARFGSGHTPPAAPIEEEKLNIEKSAVHGAGTG